MKNKAKLVGIIALAAVIGFVLISCENPLNEEPKTVATPKANPAAGPYTSAQSVTLSCTESGASIRYTTNGTNPTASSTRYSTPITISKNTTLKAIAIKSGMNNSDVLTAVYIIDIPQLETVATPTVNPPEGTYTSAQSVTLSCDTSEAAIHYTLDGSTPTIGSTPYSTPITISATTTLKAIAVKTGMNDSEVFSADYIIDIESTTDTPVTFSNLVADGSASQTTTQLTITLSAAITGLSADDITLSGVAGVAKGTLGGSGPTYTLPISGFTAGGTLSVAVAKTGYDVSDSPKTVAIFYYSDDGSGVVVKPTDNRILDPATQGTQLTTGALTVTTTSSGNQSLSGSPYGYETWLDAGGGDGKLIWYGANQGGGAAFRSEWKNPNDWLCRVGYFWNQNKPYTDYENVYCGFNYTRSGRNTAGNYSYIGIYGWSRNPGASVQAERLIEYYIVEDWFGNQWQPDTGPMGTGTTGGTVKGTYTLDGATYQVIQNTRTNAPSIAGNTTFTQFFSIRQTPRKSGTISITEHFKQWEEKGMNLGSNMYECKFLVEAGGGTGWFDASFIQFYRAKNDGTIIQITPP
jgi:endo-1,4-beta-xylanase